MTATQVEINHQAYLDNYRNLEDEHSGQFALMHDGEIIGELYDDPEQAFRDGIQKYGEGEFSVKEIGAQPVRLGAASLI